MPRFHPVRVPEPYRLAKIIDEFAGRQDIDSRQVVCAGGVVMVAVYGENRQAHLERMTMEICLPAVSQIVMNIAFCPLLRSQEY